MPVINTTGTEVKKVSGAELIERGVNKVEGKQVNVSATYKQTTKVPTPLNHNRKMKQLYNKQGLAGVNSYISAVNNFMKTEKRKAAL